MSHLYKIGMPWECVGEYEGSHLQSSHDLGLVDLQSAVFNSFSLWLVSITSFGLTCSVVLIVTVCGWKDGLNVREVCRICQYPGQDTAILYCPFKTADLWYAPSVELIQNMS